MLVLPGANQDLLAADLGLDLSETGLLAAAQSLCIGIGVEAKTLRPSFDPVHTSFVRLNYYPTDDPLTGDEAAEVTPRGDMALHHHTDAGALTILLQDDVGGLQVEVDGEWIDAEPTDGAFVINVTR